MKKPDDRFVMLGVIHRDGEGMGLLSDWLESACPDAVTLELSPYGLEYRRSKGEALKRQARAAIGELETEGYEIDGAAVDDLCAYFDPPFEFAAASGYCDRHGMPMFLVDVDRFSRRHLGRTGELLSKSSLAASLSGSGRTEAGRERAIARLFFEKGVRAFSYTGEMRARDRHMSGAISDVMERLSPACLVHVCGWRHLCDPFGEYAPLHPKKVFIHDKALRV